MLLALSSKHSTTTHQKKKANSNCHLRAVITAAGSLAATKVGKQGSPPGLWQGLSPAA